MTWQRIEKILSPRQKRRPLPLLLSLSFFYDTGPHECKHFPLQVSPLHTMYWEVSGKEGGLPAIVLHGGPGGGSQPEYR